MAKATCMIEGFIFSAESFVTRTAKEAYVIKLSTGSRKNNDGSYDNTNQAWWELWAWGEYALKLKFECLQKGDFIRATIQNPQTRVFQTKDGRFVANIRATLWNYSLSKVSFVPKSPFSQGDDENLPDEPFPTDEESEMMCAAQRVVDIPF